MILLFFIYSSPSDEQPSTITLNIEHTPSRSSSYNTDVNSATTTTTTTTTIGKDEYQIAIALVTNINDASNGALNKRGNGEELGDEQNAHEVPNEGILLLSYKLFQISIWCSFFYKVFCFQHSNEV